MVKIKKQYLRDMNNLPIFSQLEKIHKQFELNEKLQAQLEFHKKFESKFEFRKLHKQFEINEKLQVHLEPFRKFQEKFDSMRRLQDNLEPFRQYEENFRKLFSNNGFQMAVDTMMKVKPIVDDARDVAQFFTKGIKLLAKFGWYISNEMELHEMADAIRKLDKDDVQENDKIEADLIIAEFYRNNLDRIETQMTQQFPSRKEAISQAFKAHQQKMYFASIPLFLAQADGVCNGVLYKQQRRKKEKLAKFISDSSTDYLSSFLDVLTEISSIDVAHHHKDSYYSDLNRHGVLHGLDTDYGTEINSLKALSLFSFIVDFMEKKGEQE